MISVIICSINENYLAALRKNIEATIAVPYEIIAINNRERGDGICSVYNEGAGKARYELLCFIHEDIRIHTNGWGKQLAELFKDESIGLAGVSGSVYKSSYPATWSACLPECYRTNSIQHFPDRDIPSAILSNPLNEAQAEVAVIDGVFMATTKAVFQRFTFDDNLPGFHGYDIDYSLQVGAAFKVVVCLEILLEHFSAGTLNEAWLQNSLLVHEKWKQQLPRMTIHVDPKKRELNDFIALQSFLPVLLKYPGRKALVIKYYKLLISRYVRFNKLAFTRKVGTYLLK
ncbi:MAG: hypothetical protein JWQ27_173 [Ferruginibacter sp.]|nr:hypothetical protein [Ferruginibacter sp.]